MSANLTALKARLRNVAEFRGNESLLIANLAINHAEALEAKLREACARLDNARAGTDTEAQQLIADCAALLAPIAPTA